jgi:hypothetical protein
MLSKLEDGRSAVDIESVTLKAAPVVLLPLAWVALVLAILVLVVSFVEILFGTFFETLVPAEFAVVRRRWTIITVPHKVGSLRTEIET